MVGHDQQAREDNHARKDQTGEQNRECNRPPRPQMPFDLVLNVEGVGRLARQETVLFPVILVVSLLQLDIIGAVAVAREQLVLVFVHHVNAAARKALDGESRGLQWLIAEWRWSSSVEQLLCEARGGWAVEGTEGESRAGDKGKRKALSYGTVFRRAREMGMSCRARSSDCTSLAARWDGVRRVLGPAAKDVQPEAAESHAHPFLDLVEQQRASRRPTPRDEMSLQHPISAGEDATGPACIPANISRPVHSRPRPSRLLTSAAIPCRAKRAQESLTEHGAPRPTFPKLRPERARSMHASLQHRVFWLHNRPSRICRSLRIHGNGTGVLPSPLMALALLRFSSTSQRHKRLTTDTPPLIRLSRTALDCFQDLRSPIIAPTTWLSPPDASTGLACLGG
ncbi:hypothetical protein BP5796_01058 [Coleophoma crateriformis]|uniref:Uncharacterized protein n=1 Tax=Coleophoma crateriformis TaxID=565419 RepID=A0A3D8T9T6_9HELO|nr:hypothetical protein BP5796_01058 [Coleophoma crateriformis]